ncbi:cytoplasmic dynein 2 intermediate chain 1-like isoform X3 [Mercenaria mercenaria]|uniref:cytoplasmic dynein 2 intermediate chain 1-like isoform X3 n=1 Tax=Mercenaria mercenaria TaxID=6596 RepID=UPI00234FAD80|nr:cytoplasmic dynein 2 intermediate chain 1-like isoform X3 [Mercenaria mercenaria]
MPSQKTRSKEDTWTPDELNKALSKTRSKEDTWTPDELNKALSKTSERRHHRDRDEDRKRDRINGDERQRRHKEEDSDRRRKHRDEDENGRDVRLTEEERDRQREERRRKREGKDGLTSREKKGREIQFRGKSDNRDVELNDVDENDSDDRRRRHHGDRERRHHDDGDRERRRHDREQRNRDEDDDRERRRRHRDDDNDREKRRKHRDDEDDGLERRRKHRDDDDREKRRKHREEEDEEEERRRRHEEKRERRKEEDRKKDRERDRDERSDRHRDRKDRDRHKESEREKEERREREREERRREKEERHRQKEDKSSRSKQKVEEKREEEEDEYNYEEDFEDYEEDFEDEEEDEEVSRPRNVQLTQARAHNQTTVLNVSLGNKESIHKKDQAGSRLDYSDSEVNDVLRALDAENERLLNSSSRSPQVSAKYGRERGHGDSDRDEDSDDGYQKTYQPRMDRPRTAINFVSAKQRAVSRKTASKTMQRGKDLLKMLELDYASFDILDLPPVNEYDLYIRAFGSSDTRQAYVQTNDDNIDRDIQTEEIDARQKWTQHPPEDFNGCGRGDGEKDIEDADAEEESQSKYNREQDLSRLNRFLEKAGQVIAILLEEGKEEETGSKSQSQTHINVSEGYTRLEVLPILQDRHVIFSHFSPVQPNLLLTVYSPPPQISEENPVSKRGIICVWNTNEPSFPQKILVCSSQPRCCCFSPVKPSLVFAGMVDGSIAMWDLREPMSIHQPTFVNDESYSLRYPTYDTACVLKEENHHSPVSSILPIYSYIDTSKTDGAQSKASEDTSSGLSFQLVSTEESAVLHFWVVAEIGIPEIAGSENDLGLAPGAGVKLLKSSSLTMSNPSKDTRLQSGLRALDMSLMPSDPNHFYVATDSGCILHGIRFGKRTFPRAHSPVIDTIVDVVSIDFSPFDQPCFLTGCSDGTFSLYHTKSENPLITWPTITKGQAVQCIRWSRSRPCVFYVLDVTSTLYVFDLLEGDVQPKYIETISKERITSFSLTTVQRPDGLGSSGKDAQMLFSFEDGKTEIHTITKSLRVPEQLETDYLGSYLQRF